MQVYSHIAESSSIYRTPQRYPTLRGAVQIVYIHVYLELGESFCDAADQLEILCEPCCSQMRERHRCYCWRYLACRLNSPPGFAPECLYVDSNSVCKISRNSIPTSNCARTKPNKRWQRKSSTCVTFEKDTFPFKNFPFCRAWNPPERVERF